MRVAVQLHPQHASYNQIREAAIEAESLGADVIYNWDHFYPLYGEPDGAHYEAWTMLASWAEVTNRVKIGCLVTCNSYRNPNLLADMARTVDHISDGRLVLGLGAGWFERDYDEYGYEFGTAGSRLKALEAALPEISSRVDALNPKPVGDMPILIGGGGEKKTLRYTARHANIWHYWWNSEWAHKNEVLNQWCIKEGTDPASVERSIGIDTDSIEDLDAELAAIAATNAAEITVGRGGPSYDLSLIPELVSWRESLPSR